MTSLEVASPEMTGSCITGNDVTGSEREIISRVFPPYFQHFFQELLK
jgi:hypothetical protein